MAEEEKDDLDLDLDQIDTDIENKNKVEQRIRNLSAREKEAQEKAEAEAKARKELEARYAEAEKERDFYASFTDATAKYPGAAEFKDAILEKVKQGYSVEDATVATLHAEGKLGGKTPEPPKPKSPAGGSADTPITTDSGDKTVDEMSRDEKRAALEEAFEKGDLSLQ